MKQHKALQEALDQAKTANNTKDTFLSNMSHDMRTPLNAIFGYTALARKYLDDTDTGISDCKLVNGMVVWKLFFPDIRPLPENILTTLPWWMLISTKSMWPAVSFWI